MMLDIRHRHIGGNL